VAPDEVDMIVPHGAATGLSDRYEADCIGHALAGKAKRAVCVPFKPFVGHTLAASGIIETCCAVLAMKHGVAPAALHGTRDTSRFPVPIPLETTERDLQTLLKVFTGFTGHDAALVLRKL